MSTCTHVDMTTVLVGNSKGGVGKSTIATNLAVSLATRGRDVLLVDADKQVATATNWAQERAELGDSVPEVPSVQASGDLRPTLRDLRRRYQDLVIDVSARDSQELRTAMLVADILLVPTRASQADLWVLEQLSELVQDVRTINEDLRCWAVVNMAPHNTHEGDEASDMVRDEYRESFKLCRSTIHDRKAFRDAMLGGRGVLEMSNEKAIAEVAGLAAELFGKGAKRGVQARA